jgi:hypothetical protein
VSANVRVQDLVGRRVVDANGKGAGRIESIRASWKGDHCLVEAFELGSAALLHRLGISAARLFGWPLAGEPRRVPWQQMDLSDPEKPKLRCAVEELPDPKSS